MKTVLLIACICIVGAAAADNKVVEGFVRVFGITEDEAWYCVNKTNVVITDMRALETQIDEVPEEELLEQNDTRRAMCTITCAAQAQGIMIGAKMQLAKLHDFIDKEFPMPEDRRERLHEFMTICVGDMKDVTNECEAGLRFLTCIIKKNEEAVRNPNLE